MAARPAYREQIRRIGLVATTALLAMAVAAPASAAVRPAPASGPGSAVVTDSPAPQVGPGPLTVLHTRGVSRTVTSLTSGPCVVYGATDAGIVQISPTTGRVVRQVARIGAFGAQDVALDTATGDVYATAVSDARLYRVDPGTGHVTRSARFAGLLGYVAVDPVRHRVLASLPTGVVALDDRTMRELWSVQMDGFPTDLAVDSSDGTTLVATHDTTLIGIDAHGVLGGGISLPLDALHVAVDPARDVVYVGSFGRLFVVRAGVYDHTVRVRGDVTDLTVDPRTGHAYAASQVDGYIGHGYLSEVAATRTGPLGTLRLAGGAIVVGRGGPHTFVGAYPSWRTPPRLYTVAG